MIAKHTLTDTITLPDAPAIPGLSFRRFRGEADLPKMAAMIADSERADHLDHVTTLDDLRHDFEHLDNCDPYQDVIIAEVNGEVVGWGQVWWMQEAGGNRIYFGWGHIASQWQRKGLGRAMLRYNQRRRCQIAVGHPPDGPRLFETEAADTQHGLIALLKSEGYQPVVTHAQLVRPDLENIPDAPMPAGLEVRPARPEHYRQIWEAAHEAFRDAWGYIPGTEEGYQHFISYPDFDPSLWRVAWEGDEVAGMVLGFINHQENAEFKRLRGWTEGISVRRPWRRRGLARALLVQSLHAMKERGMTEAALTVHTENPNRAYQLYESVGFRLDRIDNTIYQKPMDEPDTQ